MSSCTLSQSPKGNGRCKTMEKLLIEEYPLPESSYSPKRILLDQNLGSKGILKPWRCLPWQEGLSELSACWQGSTERKRQRASPEMEVRETYKFLLGKIQVQMRRNMHMRLCFNLLLCVLYRTLNEWINSALFSRSCFWITLISPLVPRGKGLTGVKPSWACLIINWKQGAAAQRSSLRVVELHASPRVRGRIPEGCTREAQKGVKSTAYPW